MNIIENKKFPEERALYLCHDTLINNCVFDGEEDGESALKEAYDFTVKNSVFNLRYPFWHNNKVIIDNVTLTENCRAALWYTTNVEIRDSKLHGIKALRECADIELENCDIISPEFSWRSKNIKCKDISVVSEYGFFESQNIEIEKMNFVGKYSFQYVENMKIKDSTFDTKDAFWHSKNVVVKNSTIKGEYLGWYSENLTLINCKILGTQPLCYCKNLTLVDCEMIDTDLAFEYSDVKATITNVIDSVKNPKSGRIVARGIKDLIYTDDSVYECKAEVIIKDKE